MRKNKLKIAVFLPFLLSTFIFPSLGLASFKDVTETHPQYESISAFEEMGIIKGYRGYFKPDQLITRAEFLKILFSHIGFKPASRLYYNKFKDVPPESWFASYVTKALEMRGIDYNPENPFLFPDQPISKLDGLKLILPVEGIPSPFIKSNDPLIFSDVSPAANYAYLIRAAQNAGIYIPESKKQFLPFKNLTRAEAVQLIYQAQLFRESGTPGTIIIHAQPLPTLSDAETKLLENPKFPIFINVWEKINSDYIDSDKVEGNKLIYGAVSGMVNSLEDPYSVFDPPTEATNLQNNLEGTYEGIGTVIDTYENQFIIVSVVKDSPAEKAGVKAGDIIKKIDGKDITGLDGEELVNLIKGPAGSIVELTIDRDSKTLTFKITRAQVTLESVIQETSKTEIPSTIGYISISQFTSSTDNEFEDILESTMSTNPKALILDLRDNPGGYLEPTYNILGHFIEKGKTIMSLKISGENIKQVSEGQGELGKTPIAVLVNGNTASAAEVVAGALQDYKIAKLIGEQTYGKGTVQEVTTYADGSLLKLSVAKWLTPLNRSINKVGLTPDVKVNPTKTDILANNDVQLKKAIEELQKVI